MHELAITQNIVAIVGERAGERRVRRVRLEVGKLSAVLPDAIRFCFDLVAEGTVLEGAELQIVEVPGRARCRPCGAEVELLDLFAICPCGSTDLDAISGTELDIKEMDVEVP